MGVVSDHALFICTAGQSHRRPSPQCAERRNLEERGVLDLLRLMSWIAELGTAGGNSRATGACWFGDPKP